MVIFNSYVKLPGGRFPHIPSIFRAHHMNCAGVTSGQPSEGQTIFNQPPWTRDAGRAMMISTGLLHQHCPICPESEYCPLGSRRSEGFNRRARIHSSHFPHLGHLYKSTWKACWHPHYWDDIREFGGLVGLEASIAIGEQKSSRANHCFLPSTVKAFVWILWGSMTWSNMIPATAAEVLWIIIPHIWQSLTRTTNNRSKIRRSTCRWQNESEKDPLQRKWRCSCVVDYYLPDISRGYWYSFLLRPQAGNAGFSGTQTPDSSNLWPPKHDC